MALRLLGNKQYSCCILDKEAALCFVFIAIYRHRAPSALSWNYELLELVKVQLRPNKAWLLR